MGQPFFKWRELAKAKGVAVFSSNYALYADFSDRVYQVLQAFSRDCDRYSIDEAFLDVKDKDEEYLLHIAKHMREAVRRITGIPVSVGIGETKTLAKVANHYAKTSNTGVFVLRTETSKYETALCHLPVGEVWGIGPMSAAKLTAIGIQNAMQLAQMQLPHAKSLLTITGERTVLELKGVRCIELDVAPPAQKALCVSKAFGRRVYSENELREAIMTYAAAAAAKLRKQGLIAGWIQALIATSPFDKGPKISRGLSAQLISPTSNTQTIQDAAATICSSLYRPGYPYYRAGVVLTDLVPETTQQLSLLQARARDGKAGKISRTLDAINKAHGHGMIVFAGAGLSRPWQTRFENRSPRYTTDWAEIPKAFAA